MFDFHEKRKIRNIIYSKISILAVVLLTVWLSFSVVERFSVEREMAEKKERKIDELAELQKRAALLESKVDHLENDRGIEEELRSRFDVAKEGEKVVIILDDGRGTDTDVAAAKEEEIEERKTFLDILKFW